jgi:predicted XRE-type DNA-binding protein
VFADLGLAHPEDRLAKAELARRISEIIAERRLTQLEAAALLGIDQPKISALVRGRLGGFSLERLRRRGPAHCSSQDGAVYGGVAVRSPFTLSLGEEASAYSAAPAAVPRHRSRGRPRRSLVAAPR